jgi:hypothetical protein
MINEYGTVGGMITVREKRRTHRKLTSEPIFHHNS